jgi:hypothetical protein
MGVKNNFGESIHTKHLDFELDFNINFQIFVNFISILEELGTPQGYECFYPCAQLYLLISCRV